MADVAGRRSLPGHPVEARAMTHERPRTQWRQVAGPALDSRSLHAATVPDGPHSWEGGEYERIEAKNRAALVAHFAKPTPPKMPPPAAVLAGERSARAAELIASIPPDLSISPFLKRTGGAS
jgi:hypothetical protein